MPLTRHRGCLWVGGSPQGEGDLQCLSYKSLLCWQLPPPRLVAAASLKPVSQGGFILYFKVKKLGKCWKKHPHLQGMVGAPSHPWVPPPDAPFIPPGCRSIPSSSKTALPSHKNKYFGSRMQFRLPTGCRRLLLSRWHRSEGLFLLPGSLTGLLPGRFPHPIFSFPACGSWEEGLLVSIAMRLALISISFLGELITKGVTK